MKWLRLTSPVLAACLILPAQAQDEPTPEKPAAEAPAAEKPAEEKPAEEKPAEEKPAEEKPAEEKPAAEAPAEEQPAVEKKIPVEVETVVTGLTNPSGIAIQPGDDKATNVFVSDSGALKIVKFDAAKPAEVKDVVVEFPKDVYGKGPMYDIGPLGLAFINKDTLVVGDGGKVDGQELVRVYTVPEEGKTLKADEMKVSLGPIAAGDKSANGEGNFYALAVTPTAIYVTSNGDDTKGWVLKADLNGDTPSNLAPYIATKEAVEVDAPVGIAINRKGHIVVGQMGEINVPGDALLSFYSPKTGKLLMNLETGLNDITALAYSPNGRLYALDFSWVDTKKGAMYRLDDDGKGGVEAVKVVDLDKPTAMAFAPDGALYVTLFGTAEDGSTKGSGKVVKITGKL